MLEMVWYIISLQEVLGQFEIAKFMSEACLSWAEKQLAVSQMFGIEHEHVYLILTVHLVQ